MKSQSIDVLEITNADLASIVGGLELLSPPVPDLVRTLHSVNIHPGYWNGSTGGYHQGNFGGSIDIDYLKKLEAAKTPKPDSVSP
jgi:hypothetical protein